MNIIIAPFVYIDGVFKKDVAVIFDDIIHDIVPAEEIPNIYHDAEIISLDSHCVLYPGFINSHVHLEFSSNTMTLDYGAFIPWLESVMSNRDVLAKKSDEKVMKNALKEMLQSGITTIGAISSFGGDLNVCAKTSQRVVYFNEVVGSNEAIVDVLFDSFNERFEASRKYNSERFQASVAIHSPYSVHPKLLKKAIDLAKKYKTPLSAHLLESRSEREWLDENSGGFRVFFEKLFGIKESVSDLKDFLEAFNQYPTLFVHATQIEKGELQILKDSHHFIAHCPRSNRLLGEERLKIEALEGIRYSLATDGKSSNWSLNIFDELRAALMLHSHLDLHQLSSALIRSITSNPAEALGLNCGIIAKEKFADFCVVELKDTPQKLEDIALWTILHVQNAKKVYIQGEQCV
ncbi:MAG: metal-dependent hydrolase [Campylobacterales bacterium]|nr:metal-dependent hydrolase [Campylobacterales bacterium]